MVFVSSITIGGKGCDAGNAVVSEAVWIRQSSINLSTSVAVVLVFCTFKD